MTTSKEQAINPKLSDLIYQAYRVTLEANLAIFYATKLEQAIEENDVAEYLRASSCLDEIVDDFYKSSTAVRGLIPDIILEANGKVATSFSND